MGINEKILNYLSFRNGFFIESGAKDGISQSITYTLEKSYNWSGIIIETSKIAYEKCIYNRPIPTPHFYKELLIKKYAKRNNIKIFIETGTYLGEMVEATKNIFDKIISIEISKTLFEKARENFKIFKKIEILFGDSGEILKKILKDINKPVIFWLDGHYSGVETGKGLKKTPILNELELIFNHEIKNHIIIDDLHCFCGYNDYPELIDLRELVLKKSSYKNFTYKNDVIIIN